MNNGSHKGAIEHRFGGRTRILQSKESREAAQLLIQEAMIRRDFGEEGVKRFWEEVMRRAALNDEEAND